MSYKITVLVENSVPTGSPLEAEHGLSFFVETPESHFLFDCGHTGAAWRNAARMGVDLSTVQFVVLSHSHYDHAGGFPSLLEYVKPKEVYIGTDFWQEKFSWSRENDQYLYRGCGFSEADLLSWNIEQKVCRDILPLDSYAQLITGFSCRYAFEIIPEKFRRGEAKAPDPFDDEICLMLKEHDGYALIVGCSHKGILNIVYSVKDRSGSPIRHVIGGIHLSGESEDRMGQTLDELHNLGVKKLNLCHCSGANLPDKICTGSVIEISGERMLVFQHALR